MGSAAAKMSVQLLCDFVSRRCRFCLEESCRSHDKTCRAVAALGGPFRDKGLLDPRSNRVMPKGLYGDNPIPGKFRGGPHTALDAGIVHQNAARTALLETATKLCAGQTKVITQNIEKRRVRIASHLAWLIVNIKRKFFHLFTRSVTRVVSGNGRSSYVRTCPQ